MFFCKIIKKNNSGYFILNVLTSLGIIALLATLSFPYIKQYQPNIKLSAEARELTANLRLAQQLTVTEQVVHRVEFNLDDDLYDILKIGAATTTVKSTSLDPEINFQAINGFSDNAVIFNFYGGAVESGNISLVNNKGNSATVYVKPSGYVHLQ